MNEDVFVVNDFDTFEIDGNTVLPIRTLADDGTLPCIGFKAIKLNKYGFLDIVTFDHEIDGKIRNDISQKIRNFSS